MALNAEKAPCTLELEDYYQDLIGSLGAIVWEADAATFQFTFVSPQAESILGYAPEMWMQKDFWLTIIHPDDADQAVETCIRGLREGVDTEFEYRAFAADGEVRWIYDVVRLVRDDGGTVRQLRGIMLDVTEKKRTEEERGRFKARIAHDLSSPMTAVLLNADLLLSPPEDQGGLASRDLAQAIVLAAEQMQRLMADLVRGGTGGAELSLELQPVAAESLVLDSARIGAALAQNRGIKLEIASVEPAWVLADPDRILQVFGNLVGNAIRYTPSEGTIRLGCEAEEHVVRFFVADSGAGMSPSKLAAVLGSGSSPVAGLGLSIVRDIVERHGGILSAESRRGSGCSFFFTLPRACR